MVKRNSPDAPEVPSTGLRGRRAIQAERAKLFTKGRSLRHRLRFLPRRDSNQFGVETRAAQTFKHDVCEERRDLFVRYERTTLAVQLSPNEQANVFEQPVANQHIVEVLAGANLHRPHGPVAFQR